RAPGTGAPAPDRSRGAPRAPPATPPASPGGPPRPRRGAAAPWSPSPRPAQAAGAPWTHRRRPAPWPRPRPGRTLATAPATASARAPPPTAGEPLQLALRVGLELRDVEPDLLEEGHHHAFVLREQGVEQVRVIDHRIAAGPRQRRGLLQGLTGLDGQTVSGDHGTSPQRNPHAWRKMPKWQA